MRKRIISVLTAAAMLFTLSGCGKTNPPAQGPASENGTDTKTEAASSDETKAAKLTNVSYDPTRELYAAYNDLFKTYYTGEKGEEVEIVMSHGGSGGQARSVVEGAAADVVTLALEHDITLIQQAGLINEGWLSEFPLDSSPYTSTIVFLVRAGNEKELRDWDDLVKEGVEIITPDPKSSGGACWNFLAAWHYADLSFSGDETAVKDFMRKLYANVTVMDSGARGATTTFVENGQGDVLIAWENEALQTLKEYPDKFEMVSPSISILAQPSVAVVDENAAKNHSEELAADYLNYLYSDDAQQLIGEYGYRPSNEEILAGFADKFDLNMELCTIQDFGGWDEAFAVYFQDGGVFDEIYGA
ncbi:MAG: sulfate ABC transporter substrate-binding protein [Blautia sp.]|nr:sulfate ABC transporter substrate-binding protein [Blautia sp.]